MIFGIYKVNDKDDYFWQMAISQLTGNEKDVVLRHVGACMMQRGFDIPPESQNGPGILKFYLGSKSEEFDIPHPDCCCQIAACYTDNSNLGIADLCQLSKSIYIDNIRMALSDPNLADKVYDILINIVKQYRLSIDDEA